MSFFSPKHDMNHSQLVRTPQKNHALASSIRSVMKTPLAQLIGIKCAQCNLIFPQNAIDDHLITHIQPKYLTPHEENKGAKKLSRALDLTDSTLSSPDIPSLEMREFPREQTTRKDVKPPSEFGMIVHDLPPLKKDIVSYRGDQKDLYSKLDAQIEREFFQPMILTQNISLGQQEANIRSQQISLYKSGMVGRFGQKPLMRTDKKVNPFDDQVASKSKQYQILSLSENSKPITDTQQQPEGSRLLVVNIKKHRESTPRRQQINTSAKKSYLTPQTMNTLEESRSIANTSHPLECQACHGFYCYHCKSTIPPMYRPWNMQEELDPKVVDFYKKHVYRGNCVDCEKDMR